MWVENVPYEAEAGTVEAWIRGGLIAGLPHLRKLREHIAKLEEALDTANYQANVIRNKPASGEVQEKLKARQEALKQKKVDQVCVCVGMGGSRGRGTQTEKSRSGMRVCRDGW